MVTSSIALKEWTVVVEALATGQQLLLVRKGGIRDPRGTFSLEHREFLLYPTREHQRDSSIRPEFRTEFASGLRPSSEDSKVLFVLYAGVAFAVQIETLKKLERLEKYHIWTPEFFRERMNYQPNLPLMLFVVRAFRLSKPFPCAVKPDYAGCKSWVPLGCEVPVEGATPVVENQRFRQALEEITNHFE